MKYLARLAKGQKKNSYIAIYAEDKIDIQQCRAITFEDTRRVKCSMQTALELVLGSKNT